VEKAANELPIVICGGEVMAATRVTYLGRRSMRGPRLSLRGARRAPTHPSNCRTVLGHWRSRKPETMRGHLSLLRTQITRARRDGRLATPCRVGLGDLGRRARYET